MPISKKPRSKAALKTSTKAGAPAALPDKRGEFPDGDPREEALHRARRSGNAAVAPAFVEVLRAAFERGFFEIGIPCSFHSVPIFVLPLSYG